MHRDAQKKNESHGPAHNQMKTKDLSDLQCDEGADIFSYKMYSCSNANDCPLLA